MNPDLMASVITYLRLNASLVSAFADNPPVYPKFWSNYDALQKSNLDPTAIMPYLVFVEPQETKSYETKDATGNRSDVAVGVIAMDVFAPGELEARQLAEDVADYLNDCDESLLFPGIGLFYFRRTVQAMPPSTGTGPDGSPTIFRRSIQFKYFYEETLA